MTIGRDGVHEVGVTRTEGATLDSIPIIRAISTNCHHSMSVDRPSGFDPKPKFGSQFSMTGVEIKRLSRGTAKEAEEIAVAPILLCEFWAVANPCAYHERLRVQPPQLAREVLRRRLSRSFAVSP